MNVPTHRRLLLNWLILLASLASLAVALGVYYSAVTAPRKDAKGKRQGFRFNVKTADVASGDLTPSIRLQGDVVSRRQATLRAEVPGVVLKVPVREGQPVKAGDLLLQLDARDWMLALRRQQALGLQASAARAGSQSTVAKAKDLLKRLIRLDRDRLVSEESVQQARIAVQGAQAGASEAQAVAALRFVELLAAKRDLVRTKIVAPYAGRISKRLVEAGDRVAVGTPVVELVGGHGVELHLYVPAARAHQVRPGALVHYRLAGRPDARETWHQGTIERVLPVVDLASRNRTVVVPLKTPPAGYTPGLAVEARFGVGTLAGAIIVSKDALTRNGDRWVVFRVANGKAQQVGVTILGEDGLRVAVSGGLRLGDAVVVIGNEALFPNAPVNVVNTPRVTQGAAPPMGVRLGR